MSIEQHSSIIVQSWDDLQIRTAHKIAKDLFDPLPVSDVLLGLRNDCHSFFIPPTGSN